MALLTCPVSVLPGLSPAAAWQDPVSPQNTAAAASLLPSIVFLSSSPSAEPCWPGEWGSRILAAPVLGRT